MFLNTVRKSATLVSFILAFTCCQVARMQPQGENVTEIARAASDQVGMIKQSAAGKTGVPVIVLEERHNSRLGQLQHAIILARLHNQYGLKDIVLEGYLKERPLINTDWFTKAVAEKTPEARARVAVRFLKQGEISAAEFMKLVYTDINLLRSETEATYNVEPPEGSPGLDYLIAIAQRSLRQEHSPTLQKLTGEFDMLKGKPAAQERKRVEMIEFMLSADPWTASRGKAYTDEKTMKGMSGNDYLTLAREIKEHAERNSVTVSPEMLRGMIKEITFWQQRMASNDIIVQAALGAESGGNDGQVVAINIGAFHTDGVCQLLKEANRSYAAVTPRYSGTDTSDVTGDLPGDLTSEMYDRKNKLLPVFSQGLSALVLKEAGGQKKPEPVLPEKFFEAEAGLYSFVDNITEKILNPLSPHAGGQAPFGLSADDFDGKHLKINPSQIQYFPKREDRGAAVMIPVVFKQSGATVWVGATWKQGVEAGLNNVVAIIENALREVQAERATPRRAENQTGRIQMGSSTFAIVGRSPLIVKKAILSVS